MEFFVIFPRLGSCPAASAGALGINQSLAPVLFQLAAHLTDPAASFINPNPGAHEGL
jgi:hypothetical protein